MVSRRVFENYLNQLLAVNDVTDYCPNGLQVQGKGEIASIVTGVTACQALLDEAVLRKADAVLVHHGYFWKGDPLQVTGCRYHRLKTLLSHDINLFAYHLPLDVHADFGNNSLLAQKLQIEVDGVFPYASITGLGSHGHFSTALPPQKLADKIEQCLSRKPLYIAGQSDVIKTVAWCTGAAQDMLEQASEYDVDAFITGEVSERTVHLARELGVHFYAAGHHATERYGIQALGDHVAQQFSIKTEFVDIDNPV